MDGVSPLPPQTENQTQYLDFISHSTKDHWIAKQMARLIEEKGRRLGVKTFLDILAPHKAMDIYAFDDYLEQLVKRVRV